MILAVQAGVLALRQPSFAGPGGRKILGALAVLCIAAWVVLAVMTAGGMAMGGMSRMPGMPRGDMSFGAMRRSPPVLGTSFATAVTWALMIVAMMLPSALPAATYVASHSLRWRRSRATAQFAAGYVLVWLTAGAAILAVTSLIAPRRWGLPAVLCGAALWQLTPMKRLALLDCHRPIPLPPAGWKAELASARFGLRNSWACVRSCWVMMLVMGVTSVAPFACMLAIACLTSAEKFSRQPGRASRRVTGVLALAAAAVALASVA